MYSKALLSFIAAAAVPFAADGFAAPSPRVVRRSAVVLRAVADPPAPPPAEHRKEDGEQLSESTDTEWTETGGGFIPNIIRRAKRRGTERRRHPDVEHVLTIDEYKAAVADEADRIVVVRFFAPWCRACRAAAPLFVRLASEYSPRGVKFVEVPLTRDNAYLHQGLGVPSVPFAHIYHPDAGLVEEMKMNKNEFPALREVLEDYVRGCCDVFPFEEDDYTEGEGLNEFQ